MPQTICVEPQARLMAGFMQKTQAGHWLKDGKRIADMNVILDL
jgi:hypothetical protein